MRFYFALLLTAALFSCNKKKSTPLPPPSTATIIAVWTKPDSTKELNVFLRVIDKRVQYDSATGKDVIIIDTTWGRPVYMDLIDSAGKPILDSLGRRRTDPRPRYIRVSKDSVSWRVENIPTDSLLKKGK